MAAEEYGLRLSFTESLKNMPPSAVVLFIGLIDCSKRKDHPHTLEELGSLCNLTHKDVCGTLEWLETAAYITVEGATKKRTVTLNPVYFGDVPAALKISYDKEDKKTEAQEEKIRFLEREVIRAETGDRDGLAEATRGDERAVLLEITGFLGRSLSIQEAYYLGQLIQGFGCERVIKAFRQRKGNASPLRSVYVMLKRGAAGKPALEKESANVEQRVKYLEL